MSLTNDPWPWNSIELVRLSRYMLLQNTIKLSTAVHELSCAQTKNLTKTIQSVATAQTVKISKLQTKQINIKYRKRSQTKKIRRPCDDNYAAVRLQLCNPISNLSLTLPVTTARGDVHTNFGFFPTLFSFWIRNPFGSDRRTNGQTDGHYPYCGLLRRPHNNKSRKQASRKITTTAPSRSRVRSYCYGKGL